VNISAEFLSEYRSSIMGLAILSIMLFHQQWIGWPPFNAFHIWGHYGVDIFLFVSGFGLAFSLVKYKLVEFYCRRLLRLAPMCLFCGIIKWLIFYTNHDVFQDINGIGYMTILGLDLWFIQTIAVLYLLAPLLYRLVSSHLFIMLFLVYLGCAFTTVFFPNVLNNVTGSINRLPAFIIGMAFATKGYKKRNNVSIMGLFFLLIAMISTLVTTKNYFHYGNDLWMYPILALGLISLIGIMLFLLVHSSQKVLTILKSIGNHSLELYLWHEFVFSCFWLTLNKWCPYELVFVIAIATSFIFSYVSSFCVRRIMLLFPQKM